MIFGPIKAIVNLTIVQHNKIKMHQKANGRDTKCLCSKNPNNWKLI